MSGPPSAALTILFVCTGNICRSAFAERLGRGYLDAVLDGDGASIRLSSAGTRAVVGSAMHADTALVLRGFGGDPGSFTASQLDAESILAADLVLTMTRAHRSAVLDLEPRALARTFTLCEASELLSELATAAGQDDAVVDLDGLARHLADARRGRPGSDADDVPDPIGRSPEFHEEVGERIAAALLPLLARLSASVLAGRPGEPHEGDLSVGDEDRTRRIEGLQELLPAGRDRPGGGDPATVRDGEDGAGSRPARGLLGRRAARRQR
jgi:protein-tyrosine phosphatase